MYMWCDVDHLISFSTCNSVCHPIYKVSFSMSPHEWQPYETPVLVDLSCLHLLDVSCFADKTSVCWSFLSPMSTSAAYLKWIKMAKFIFYFSWTLARGSTSRITGPLIWLQGLFWALHSILSISPLNCSHTWAVGLSVGGTSQTLNGAKSSIKNPTSLLL